MFGLEVTLDSLDSEVFSNAYVLLPYAEYLFNYFIIFPLPRQFTKLYFRNRKVGKIGHPNLLQWNLFEQQPHSGIRLSIFFLFHTGYENVIPVVFEAGITPTLPFRVLKSTH